MRHRQVSSVLHEALAVVVVLIEVGVVAAGHGAVHAASAGRLGCALTRDSISACMQRDLVADKARHPDRNHLR